MKIFNKFYLRSVFQLVGFICCCGISLFSIINHRAIYARASYHLKQFTLPGGARVLERGLSRLNGIDSTIHDIAQGYNATDYSMDDVLVIPHLSISAPIMWSKSSESLELEKQMLNGVVHDPRTPLPGAGVGNVFITGHSSASPLEKSEYSAVFANLENLENGNSIHIRMPKEGKVYTYKVEKTFVTHASDMSVFDQSKSPRLTLMTCWPLGTSWKRFIVQSEFVSAKYLEKSSRATESATSN